MLFICDTRPQLVVCVLLEISSGLKRKVNSREVRHTRSDRRHSASLGLVQMEHIDSPRLSTKLTKAQPAVDVLIKRTFISLPLYCLLLVGISVQATLASGNVDDSSDRPFFVFSLNVCNAPSQLIYEFEAKGDQLSFKLVNGECHSMCKVNLGFQERL